MTQLPAKLVSHKGQCPRCHAANGLSDLCRIGRRLFLGWFRALDEDNQMFCMVSMPPEMRAELQKEVDFEREVVFGDKLQ